MRRYAYFPGCKIAHHLPEHGHSVRAVCAALDIELVSTEFSCCGYPVRHESQDAAVFSALFSLAKAQALGLDLMTPCKCCFGNFQHARHQASMDENLKHRMKKLLRETGLDFPDRVRVFHLLQILDQNRDALLQAVRTPWRGLKVACHYGCHALRPSQITHFDDPLAPTIFERLVTAIGAEPVLWDLRLECCGHPLRGRDDAIAGLLREKKLRGAAASGADVLATACTYCQMQFGHQASRSDIPAVLYPQLLGVALGISPEHLRLSGIFWSAQAGYTR
ncbi:MAG: CoB--CoM heterodisulfide reductase [Desulfomicrobiaceae bacterium]|jgi:heterodisulfide reductase subunit B|nr:CoB--CoM heterodisulfide reductase [Desulfomicrobiaceae bacterium]MBZ4684739.1 CoB--CoM heterodisulfide reductase [Desulfomicrobiaceae bacterium]HCF05482.1 CoB--CoM heterodisulfide reductase [Desulfomicrobiaceae bacterium]